jgi:hypothetical protein
MYEAHEAACPVAALGHLSAVCIENAIAEIGLSVAGAFDKQQLVAADAAMPVGQAANLLGGQFNDLVDRIDDHEIVAEAVHFRKFQHHDVAKSIIKNSPQRRKER